MRQLLVVKWILECVFGIPTDFSRTSDISPICQWPFFLSSLNAPLHKRLLRTEPHSFQKMEADMLHALHKTFIVITT